MKRSASHLIQQEIKHDEVILENHNTFGLLIKIKRDHDHNNGREALIYSLDMARTRKRCSTNLH